MATVKIIVLQVATPRILLKALVFYLQVNNMP